MVEHIEREAALLILHDECLKCATTCEEFDGFLPDCGQCNINDAGKRINALPTADVRPVVRGHWTLQYDGDGLWHCSECGSRYIHKLNFCSHCGADMRPEPPKEEDE